MRAFPEDGNRHIGHAFGSVEHVADSVSERRRTANGPFYLLDRSFRSQPSNENFVCIKLLAQLIAKDSELF